MKHKSKLVPPPMPGVAIDEFTDVWHPMSYYLLGGTDLNGEVADNTATVEYDNDEQLEEIYAEGMSSVPLGDPRFDYFDMVEMAGAKNTEKALSESPKLAETATED